MTEVTLAYEEDEDDTVTLTEAEDAGEASTKHLSNVIARFDTSSRNPAPLAGMLLRVLSNYEPNFSWGFFVGDMLSYQSNWGKTWKDYLRGIRDTVQENAKDDIFVWHRHIDKHNIEHLQGLVRKECPELPRTLPDWHNVMFFADLLDLNPIEREMLKFFAYISDCSYYETNLLYRTYSLFEDLPKCLAAMMDLDVNEVQKVVRESFLFKSGLVNPSTDSRMKGFYILADQIRPLVLTDYPLDMKRIEEVLFPQNLSTALSIEDYGKEEEIKVATGLIGDAIRESRVGVNVLLYGLPGTGKTELAVGLAQKYGWNLKVIGDVSDQDDQEKGRALRLLNLKLGLKLYRNTPNVVLLFDEMEDLFKVDTNAAFSKAYVNRLIEKAPIPIIWTSNSLLALGDAVVRRMTFSIPFDVPKTAQRIHIWTKYRDQYDLNLTDDDIEQLGENYEVVPALISNAAKVANSNGLDGTTIQKVMSNLDRAMSANLFAPLGVERKIPKRYEAPKEYDPSLVNAEMDLLVLTEKLKSAKRNFSICLFGPAGTGKSEYARWLSTQMGMKFLFKKYSDLSSMWLGQTEKNIAKAFEEAKERERVLIIDEADSFMASRAGATKSWEVTQVNEMLTQMERHDQPFICTTNLMANLDEAVISRFTFKMKFDFLKPEQAGKMFERYFETDAPREIMRQHLLVPRDFANVKKKADILGITDAVELWNMLEDDLKMKPQFTKPIGF